MANDEPQNDQQPSTYPPTDPGSQQSPGVYYQSPAAHYPPPKKRKVWPWILGGGIGVFILFLGGCVALVGIIGKSLDSGKPTVHPGNDSPRATKGSGPSFPGKQGKDTAAKAGDFVTVDGVTITSAPLRQSNGKFGDGAYLCTEVTIKNESNKPARFSSVWDWKLQNPSGTIRDASLFGTENGLSSGEVAPGGTATGDVCFENQVDPGTYVVLLDPTIRLSSDRIGWINAL